MRHTIDDARDKSRRGETGRGGRRASIPVTCVSRQQIQGSASGGIVVYRQLRLGVLHPKAQDTEGLLADNNVALYFDQKEYRESERSVAAGLTST